MSTPVPRWTFQRLAVVLATVTVAASASSPEDLLATDLSTPPGYSAERLAFESDVQARVAPFARALPDFAGIYLDNDRGGRAVVLLTSPDANADQAMREMVPGAPGLETRVVENSYAALVAAVDNAWSMWLALGRSEELVGVGLDEIDNEVDVYVATADLEEALDGERALSAALGVPVEIIGGEAVQTTVCSRDNCVNPMKAGNRIHVGSPTSPGICTMAFHVRYGSDEQFVTAGHCGAGGAGGTKDKWYHQGLPDFAHIEQENELRAGGFDMQRVQLKDAQASAKIYGVSWIVGNWTWPLVGSVAGVSAGHSDRVVWNIVRQSYYTYGIDGVSVRGARMDSTPGGLGGDSGSPVFHLLYQRAYAIGTGSGTVTINGTVYDVFARFGDAAAEWGITPVSG